MKIYRSKNIYAGLAGIALSVIIFFACDAIGNVWVDIIPVLCLLILFDLCFGAWSIYSLFSGLLNEGRLNFCLKEVHHVGKTVEIDIKSPILWNDIRVLIVGKKRYYPTESKIDIGSLVTVIDYHCSADNSHVILVGETVFFREFLTCFTKP